jgi:hypothetical protein
VLVLAEHFGDTCNGADMMDFVGRSQGQAAAAATLDA